jgi:hypothetical protein
MPECRQPVIAVTVDHGRHGAPEIAPFWWSRADVGGVGPLWSKCRQSESGTAYDWSAMGSYLGAGQRGPARPIGGSGGRAGRRTHVGRSL